MSVEQKKKKTFYGNHKFATSIATSAQNWTAFVFNYPEPLLL